ncbi:icarapin-like [Vespula pensylvanica]|uniref:icarapin-like n=1 Tax=Vespula pensylvanica TaxID=30213 RepID=UPI001CB9E1E8|nr:icarapin-like [Vespula pensylvanica]
MKLFFNIYIIATCFLAFSYAFPAFDTSEESDEKKNVDTVLILPGSDMDMFGRPNIPGLSDSSDSDESWSLFRPSSVNFDYLRQSLRELMKRLRDHMADMASNFPLNSEFVTRWNKIPEGANTTSTTKIINGHVVTINETVYSNGNDTEGTIIRVRVIDVKPQNETTIPQENENGTVIPTSTITPTENDNEATTPQRSVETVEEFDNEIPNQGDVLKA